MNLTTATPAQIDTAYAPIAEALSLAEYRLNRARTHRAPTPAFITKAEQAVTTARQAAAPYEDEWDRRGGWNRAYLVQDTTGHIHSSTHCSTLHKGTAPTSLAFLPELSGHSEAEIIDAAGWRACTVCYPNAPVGDPRSLPSKVTSKQEAEAQRGRNERAKAKAEREAKRIANAPTVDGSPLVLDVGHGREPLRTERTASTAYVDQLFYAALYRSPISHVESLRAIEEALAGKHGRSVSEERAALVKKARAKAKREGVDPSVVADSF